jgi:hypothetical protein
MNQSQLKEILDYDRETGIFRWAKDVGSRARKGCAAGGYNTVGYIAMQVKGRRYYAHRLAWLYCYGDFPSQIDHINHNKSDNSISNLRAVSGSDNKKNSPIQANNKSGCTGVHWNNRDGNWISQIRAEGVSTHLGVFEIKEEAIESRRKAEIKYGYHENHGSKDHGQGNRMVRRHD